MPPIPSSVKAWLHEIAEAYQDALDTMPFGTVINHSIEEKDLFHLAPIIALKIRGIKDSKKNLEKVTEAALCSYVANVQDHDSEMSSPITAFAFCYLASHYGLDLVSEEVVEEVMAAIDENPKKLQRLVAFRGNT